jgi:hypothetical protein
VLTAFLENGATGNSERHIETITNLKKCMRRKGAEIENVLLKQVVARPDTGAATTCAIVCTGFTLLPHPAYSLDLDSSNFHLFPKLKEGLRGQNFSCDEGS